MFSSPYVLHVFYGLALTSISMNLVSLRRTAEDEKYRITAQLSILDSIRQQLQDAKEPLSTAELERLRRLAMSSKMGGEGAGADADGGGASAGTDVSWSAIFRGKAPVVSEETSKWDQQDLETSMSC